MRHMATRVIIRLIKKALRNQLGDVRAHDDDPSGDRMFVLLPDGSKDSYEIVVNRILGEE